MRKEDTTMIFPRFGTPRPLVPVFIPPTSTALGHAAINSSLIGDKSQCSARQGPHFLHLQPLSLKLVFYSAKRTTHDPFYEECGGISPFPQLFREIGKTPPLHSPEREEEAVEKKEDRTLHCAVCRLHITAENQKIARDGKHAHAFFNPSGLLFEIGCFSAAPGCRQTGPKSYEFSWFSGFSWRVCLCAGCGVHLGWFFHAAGAEFHGLILDMLIPMDREG